MSEGWIIEVKDKRQDSKQFETLYLISYGRDGSFKGGTHREMAKRYVRESTVAKIVRELNEKPFCSASAEFVKD